MANRVQIQVEATDAASGVLRGIIGSLGGLGNIIGDLTEKNISWGNVAADATQLFIQQAQESIKAAEEAAIVEAKVQAVIQASGGAAGVTAGQLDEWATSLSRVTGIEDETIKNAEAMAVSLGLSGDSIRRATQDAADWGAVMGGDVQSNLTIISTVLETGTIPRTLKFSAALKDQIKQALDAGDKNKALGLILSELETRYAGAAQKINDAGTKTNNLKNEIENLREEVAKNWIPTLRDSNEGAAAGIEIITAWVKAKNDQIEVDRIAEQILEQQNLAGSRWHSTLTGLTLATGEQAQAAQYAAEKMLSERDAVDQTIPSLDNLTGATKAASEANQGMVSLIGNISGETDNFKTKSMDLILKQEDLKNALVALTSQGYLPNTDAVQNAQDHIDKLTKKFGKTSDEVKNARIALNSMTIEGVSPFTQKVIDAQGALDDLINNGIDPSDKKFKDAQATLNDLTNNGLNQYTQKIADAKKAVDDNAQAIKDLAIAHDKAMAQILIDLEKTKLMSDGTFSDMDKNIILAMEHAAGIVDDKTIQMGMDFDTVATAIQNGKIKADDFEKALEAIQRGITVDIYVNGHGAWQDVLSMVNVGAVTQAREGGTPTTKKVPAARDERGNLIKGNASGGSFIIPSEYGYEGFSLGGIQTASAGERVTISPNGGGGSVVFNFPNYIGTQQDLKRAMYDAVRQMQLDGRVPS